MPYGKSARMRARSASSAGAASRRVASRIGRHLDRHSGDHQRCDARIIDRQHHLPGLHLGIVHRLADIVDRRAGDSGGQQQIQPMLESGDAAADPPGSAFSSSTCSLRCALVAKCASSASSRRPERAREFAEQLRHCRRR